MDSVLHIPGFLGPEELSLQRDRLERRWGLVRETGGRLGFGPRYGVIDGETVARELPGLAELGERRVRPALEEAVRHPVELLRSPRRAMGVLVYQRPGQGFRWHYDGHDFSALLVLENSNAGETQVVSERLSRLVRPWSTPSTRSRTPCPPSPTAASCRPPATCCCCEVEASCTAG